MKAGRMVAAALLALGACRRIETPNATTAPDTIHGTVDSIFPVAEEIRRFKAARGDATATSLNGGAESRDELVENFMAALERRDTARLSAMVISAAEFIDLYYPTSIYSYPPYRQSPELLWFLMQQNSQKGIRRALERHGGMRPQVDSYACRKDPAVWGENRLWEWCVLHRSPTLDAPRPIRLFGGILERGGRFKFVSYANDL